ncbi:AhpC/TSA family protein [Chitinophaga horti]|uniref:AhpC/TSA family protein n=1 Tax=Chitinophaga horti TaxID=2920382 RepID=A0ABY6IWU2_9BACT|nr:TlpA disulfide reductase family protein [Chitinophaga horti]UYQ91708.1 AhpC/TSA family protein [Chitinophaga horti]
MMTRILMATMLVPALASAQSGKFTLTGNIGNLNAPAKVYIDYSSDGGGGNTDSAVVVNGKFTFSGKLTGRAGARMSLDHEGKGKPFSIYSPGADVIYFYFGEENIKFSSKDSLSNAKVTGSKVYDEHIAYNKAIGGSIMELTKQYQDEYAAASPEDKRDNEFMAALNAKQENLRKKRSEKQLEFAKNNPNSYFALVALSETGGMKPDVAVMTPLYNALSPKLKDTDMGRELKQRLASVKLTEVGQPAPAFTQNDLNGKPLSLASLKGKVVLLDFWASWCSPCRAENPNMLKQYKIYKDKGFEILSVSLDSDKSLWLKAIEDDGLPWLHVSDLKGWSNEVGRLYGVRGVPACYLIDKDGKIIADNVRGEKLNEKLKEVFAN